MQIFRQIATGRFFTLAAVLNEEQTDESCLRVARVLLSERLIDPHDFVPATRLTRTLVMAANPTRTSALKEARGAIRVLTDYDVVEVYDR